MKKTIAIAVSMAATPAIAGTVTVTIPRINVAEYHVPYVAVWIEPKAGGPARTLALWYDVDKRGAEPGTKCVCGRGRSPPRCAFAGVSKFVFPLISGIGPLQKTKACEL